MTEAPRKIWLQEPIGPEGEEERSWCVEPQSDEDDLYHHDDVVQELREALEEAREYVEIYDTPAANPSQKATLEKIDAALAKIAPTEGD